LLSSPQRTQRSQVFDRKLDQVSIFVEPLVARQAPDKLLAAIVDFDKRLFALDAVLGHWLEPSCGSCFANAVTMMQEHAWARPYPFSF
jgi:hypothetical protein